MKIFLIILAVVVIYSIINQPEQSAVTAGNAGDWIEQTLDSLSTFLHSLTSGRAT